MISKQYLNGDIQHMNQELESQARYLRAINRIFDESPLLNGTDFFRTAERGNYSLLNNRATIRFALKLTPL